MESKLINVSIHFQERSDADEFLESQELILNSPKVVFDELEMNAKRLRTYRDLDFNVVLDLIISIGMNVGANIIADLIYEKLKKIKIKLFINQKEIRLSGNKEQDVEEIKKGLEGNKNEKK